MNPRNLAAMIRDASSGEVLAIARGGSVDIAPRSGNLEVNLSTGVGSMHRVVPVMR